MTERKGDLQQNQVSSPRSKAQCGDRGAAENVAPAALGDEGAMLARNHSQRRCGARRGERKVHERSTTRGTHALKKLGRGLRQKRADSTTLMARFSAIVSSAAQVLGRKESRAHLPKSKAVVSCDRAVAADPDSIGKSETRMSQRHRPVRKTSALSSGPGELGPPPPPPGGSQ